MRAVGDLIADAAAATLRAAIVAAGGREVFAVGACDANGRIAHLDFHAHGHEHAVNAFVGRTPVGAVMVHNHPSGQLEPSDADLELAGRAGTHGAGFYIVDNDVMRVFPVVLPWRGAVFRGVDVEAVAATFAADGDMAARFDGYVRREGQVALARAVARAFHGGGAFLYEAGTGIGKSFAYLVAALDLAEHNQTPVVVSTASIALQEQLLGKDVPALARVRGRPIRAVVLKGRGNYVSIRRARQWLAAPPALFPHVDAGLRAIFAQWLDVTSDGDRANLPDGAEGALWDDVQSESDNCLRARCPHFHECYYFRSRREAAVAHIVVVNHALLTADFALRHAAALGQHEAALLPPYQHVVVDEAHQLEHFARNQFGVQVSERAVQRALQQLHRSRGAGTLVRLRAALADLGPRLPADLHRSMAAALGEAMAAVPRVEAQAATWFAALDDDLRAAGGDDAMRMPRLDAAFDALAASGGELATGLESLARVVTAAVPADVAAALPSAAQGMWLEAHSRAERLMSHAAAIRAVLGNRSAREVSWVERSGRQRRPALHLRPIDVGTLLYERAWSRLRTSVFVSATLQTAPGDFRLLERGLGLGPLRPANGFWPSPFPYVDLVLLGIVRGSGGDWRGDGGDAVVRLVAASGGSALVLCTSREATRTIGARLRAAATLAGIRTLVQGEAAPARLAQQFRDDPSSVLVGTATFWEGLDVVGAALRHVIVTKLPFAVPTHPLEQARQEWADAQGGRAFNDVSVPEAVMRFRQGFGRLVRTSADWGAVSILDERVRTRPYGRRFLAALPPGLPVCEGDVATVATQIAAWFAAHAAAPPSE